MIVQVIALPDAEHVEQLVQVLVQRQLVAEASVKGPPVEIVVQEAVVPLVLMLLIAKGKFYE